MWKVGKRIELYKTGIVKDVIEAWGQDLVKSSSNSGKGGRYAGMKRSLSVLAACRDDGVRTSFFGSRSKNAQPDCCAFVDRRCGKSGGKEHTKWCHLGAHWFFLKAMSVEKN